MFRKEYEEKIKENYNNRFKKYKRFNRNKFNMFKDLFGIFEPNVLYDFYTFARVLNDNDINIKDFIEFVQIVKDIQKESIIIKENLEKDYFDKIYKDYEKRLPKCPKCNSIMEYKSINIPQGKQNLKGWKSYFLCTNEKCLYEEFSKKQFNIKNQLEIIHENNEDNIIDPDMDNLFGININDIKKEK